MFSILAFALSPEQIGLLVVVPLFAALAVGFFFRKGAEHFARHEAYGDVAHFFGDLKLEHLSTIFTKLAIGNHIGVIKEIEFLVKTIKDPAQRKVLVASTFYNLLGTFVEDAAEWPKVLKVVQSKLDVLGSQKARDVQAITAEAASSESPVIAATPAAMTAEQIQKVMGKLS